MGNTRSLDYSPHPQTLGLGPEMPNPETLLGGSRLIKNLGVSGLFQDLESSEVICGVLQAAILDSCQQVLGLCTFRYGEYSNHNVVRVW